MNDRTLSVVIYVVSAIWVANIVAGITRFHGWQPSESVNGTFMAIVGGALTIRTMKQRKDDDE